MWRLVQPVRALPKHGVQVAAEVSGDAMVSQHLQQRARLGNWQRTRAPWLGLWLRDYGQRIVPVHHHLWAAAMAPAQTEAFLELIQCT